jgi:nicotinamidase-related amidase
VPGPFGRASRPGIATVVTASGRADALILVDVIADFGHDNGGKLVEAFRRALPNVQDVIRRARSDGMPVVYANDHFGTWSGDRATILAEAFRRAPDPALLEAVTPEAGDAFLAKPRYSAFDHTPLDLLLRERGTRRVLLAGTATEMCVTQTAIDAREAGYQATILVPACSSVDDEDAAIALRYLERVVGARLHADAGSLPGPAAATSTGS